MGNCCWGEWQRGSSVEEIVFVDWKGSVFHSTVLGFWFCIMNIFTQYIVEFLMVGLGSQWDQCVLHKRCNVLGTISFLIRAWLMFLCAVNCHRYLPQLKSWNTSTLHLVAYVHGDLNGANIHHIIQYIHHSFTSPHSFVQSVECKPWWFLICAGWWEPQRVFDRFLLHWKGTHPQRHHQNRERHLVRVHWLEKRRWIQRSNVYLSGHHPPQVCLSIKHTQMNVFTPLHMWFRTNTCIRGMTQLLPEVLPGLSSPHLIQAWKAIRTIRKQIIWLFSTQTFDPISTSLTYLRYVCSWTHASKQGNTHDECVFMWIEWLLWSWCCRNTLHMMCLKHLSEWQRKWAMVSACGYAQTLVTLQTQ